MTTTKHEQTRAAWDEIAAGYDRYVTPTHMWLGSEALRRAEVGPGTRLLDVACGSGALSIPAARLGARVTAVDQSPVMVERIAARAREEGLSDLVASVMDGHDLDIEDDRFDVSASQFGVMLFPDLPRGLRELARVTRPGGRVLMVAYGPPAGVEFIGVFLEAIAAVVPGFTGLPTDPPPLPFQAAEPARLTRELVAAGLRDVTLETIVETMAFRSGHQLWDWVVNSNPVGRILVADATPAQRTRIRDGLDEALRGRAGADGAAVLRAPVNIAVGTA